MFFKDQIVKVAQANLQRANEEKSSEKFDHKIGTAPADESSFAIVATVVPYHTHALHGE